MRVLVIDDSLLYRTLVAETVEAIPQVKEVVVAKNGADGLKKAEELQPDVITLDVIMPDINGIDVLRKLKASEHHSHVIILSGITREGTRSAMEAIELGAVAVVTKPNAGLTAQDDLAKQLGPILAELSAAPSTSTRQPAKAAEADSAKKPARTASRARPEIVAFGASTGGPKALIEIISVLPGDLGVPMVVALHMPPGFTTPFAELLNRKSALTVVEAEDAQSLNPGTVYLAPGGRQMSLVLAQDSAAVKIQISDPASLGDARPSVDHLFQSVAQVYGSRSLGIILTGMGKDGVSGLRAMKEQRARIIAQDQESSVVFGMPMEAINAGIVDKILPLEGIAGQLVQWLRR